MSPTLGPSSSLTLVLVFIKEIQRIVTNKHNHGQMILGPAAHASRTTKDTFFPKNRSLFNWLVTYFPVFFSFFFLQRSIISYNAFCSLFPFHCQITQPLGSLPNSLGSLFHGLIQDDPF